MKTKEQIEQLLKRFYSLNEQEALGDYAQEVSGMMSALRWVIGKNNQIDDIEQFVADIEESLN